MLFYSQICSCYPQCQTLVHYYQYFTTEYGHKRVQKCHQQNHRICWRARVLSKQLRSHSFAWLASLVMVRGAAHRSALSVSPSPSTVNLTTWGAGSSNSLARRSSRNVHSLHWDSVYIGIGLSMEKGNSPNSRIGWDRWVWGPGAFKLDHLQPFKPILFRNIFIFFTFILGGQFLLPQRAINGKREFSQLQNWMRQMGLGAWGIQTGPFATL